MAGLLRGDFYPGRKFIQETLGEMKSAAGEGVELCDIYGIYDVQQRKNKPGGFRFTE